MRKKNSPLFLLLLLWTFSANAQSENWFIQVGVFENKVDLNYFDPIGSNVFYSLDAFGFHRYYLGTYASDADARKVAAKVNQEGYNAYVIDPVTFNSCACNQIPRPRALLNSIENIFFDFDRYSLRQESQKQLKELNGILKEFPEYQVTLRAHTDAKGSNAYNDALSLRRANAAKRYLTAKGISTDRLRTETFGEENPIAKNELQNGVDTEVGRQFNRRVEIIILDKYGNPLHQMVNRIEVPNDLEN